MAPSTGSARRPGLPLIFAISVFGVSVNTVIAPVLPEIMADLGLTAAGGGLVVAASTVPGIITAPLIGVAADRYGRRVVLVPALVLFGLAGVLASFAPSFGALLALRVAQGVGSSALMGLAVVLITDHVPGPRRARAIGQNAAAVTMAVALAPVVGGLLTLTVGTWRAAFAPFGLALLLAYPVWHAVPSGPAATERPSLDGEAMGRVLRAPGLARSLVCAAVVFLFMYGLLFTILPIYADTELGLNAGARTALLSSAAISASVVALSAGRLAARWGLPTMLRAGSVLFAITFALLALHTSLAVLIAAVVAFGLAQGLTLPSLQERLVRQGPDANRGLVMSLWVSGTRVGQTAGPVLGGSALVAVGATAVFAVAVVLAAGLLALVASEPRVPRSAPDHLGARPEPAPAESS